MAGKQEKDQKAQTAALPVESAQKTEQQAPSPDPQIEDLKKKNSLLEKEIISLKNQLGEANRKISSGGDRVSFRNHEYYVVHSNIAKEFFEDYKKRYVEEDVLVLAVKRK